jgi:hypothetical protein
MMADNIVCYKSECTVAQTGTCILNNDPLTCPDRLQSLHSTDEITSMMEKEPVLSSPTEAERLTASYTLSINDANKLMHERYCKIVGILGSPNSGKTACLVSLYLLLAHNRLSGFSFRDSKTIMAFEEISRGARRWNDANFPDQLTVHTEFSDERSAGFLHLRLHADQQNKTLDLLLPDIPGEWSTSFIDKNRSNRLNFLKSAECIWIMVNGEEISNEVTRYHTTHRLGLLIQRLANLLDDIRPPLTLVVTHKDRFEFNGQHYDVLNNKSQNNGFNFKILQIASFSDNPRVQPGDGIADLIVDLLSMRNNQASDFWPKRNDNNPTRQILRYGQYE